MQGHVEIEQALPEIRELRFDVRPLRVVIERRDEGNLQHVPRRTTASQNRTKLLIWWLCRI